MDNDEGTGLHARCSEEVSTSGQGSRQKHINNVGVSENVGYIPKEIAI